MSKINPAAMPRYRYTEQEPVIRPSPKAPPPQGRRPMVQMGPGGPPNTGIMPPDEDMAAIAAHFVDSALLNWGDEATAGLMSLLPGRGNYRQELDQFHNIQDHYRQQNPDRTRAIQYAGGAAALPAFGGLGAMKSLAFPSVGRLLGGYGSAFGGAALGSLGEVRNEDPRVIGDDRLFDSSGPVTQLSQLAGIVSPVAGGVLGGLGAKQQFQRARDRAKAKKSKKPEPSGAAVRRAK